MYVGVANAQISEGVEGVLRAHWLLQEVYTKLWPYCTAFDTTIKEGRYLWNAVAQQAFEKLKNAMTTAPVLALPNFDLTFEVEFDASSLGIGAVLSQAGKPIAFYSKTLSPRH